MAPGMSKDPRLNKQTLFSPGHEPEMDSPQSTLNLLSTPSLPCSVSQQDDQ